MVDGTTFETAEQTLGVSLELLDEILAQNEKWPGSGVLESDVKEAGILLRQMSQALAEVIAAVISESDTVPYRDQRTEIHEAVQKAFRLIGRLYGDVKIACDTGDDDRSQTDAVRRAELHLQQLVAHCHRTRDFLLKR